MQGKAGQRTLVIAISAGGLIGGAISLVLYAVLDLPLLIGLAVALVAAEVVGLIVRWRHSF